MVILIVYIIYYLVLRFKLLNVVNYFTVIFKRTQLGGNQKLSSIACPSPWHVRSRVVTL